MKQHVKVIAREILRQVFGIQKPRDGKIVLSRHAFDKMTEHKIDRVTLENAFRFGKKTRAGMILHKYARYSIGLYYTRIQSPVTKALEVKQEQTYIITTCWRGR